MNDTLSTKSSWFEKCKNLCRTWFDAHRCAAIYFQQATSHERQQICFTFLFNLTRHDFWLQRVKTDPVKVCASRRVEFNSRQFVILTVQIISAGVSWRGSPPGSTSSSVTSGKPAASGPGPLSPPHGVALHEIYKIFPGWRHRPSSGVFQRRATPVWNPPAFSL